MRKNDEGEEALENRAREVEGFFHERANHVDELARLRWDQEAAILATTALDALGAVWFCDFPEEERKLAKQVGGNVPASLRMSQLVGTFAPDDEHARKVAVVCFAEDMRRHCRELAALAAQLLKTRVEDEPLALPRAYLDKTPHNLLVECPELASPPGLLALIEEYTYPALLYRFFRCPMVHMASGSKRTHGFARGREVMYMRIEPRKFTSISFGPQLMTDWIRKATSGYVAACLKAGIRPANQIDAGAEHEAKLDDRWRRLKLDVDESQGRSNKGG